MDVNNSSAVRRMRRPQIRPAWARRYELTLVGRRTVAQNVLRVTLSGFDLEEFRYQGGDHRCTLLIPWPAEEARRFMWPTASDPWTGAAQWGFIAALTRPLRRPLTVSGYRPEQLEIDFDILLHGDSPLTTWARGVRPGTAVRVIDNGRRYRVPDGTRTQILIADEAGAPAALAVAAETPPSVPTALYIPGTVAAAEGRHPGGHVSVVTVPARSGDRTPEKRFAEAVRGRGRSSHPGRFGAVGRRRTVVDCAGSCRYRGGALLHAATGLLAAKGRCATGCHSCRELLEAPVEGGAALPGLRLLPGQQLPPAVPVSSRR